MKTVRILLFLLLLGFSPQVAYCQDDTVAESGFPDLLADEFDGLEDNEFWGDVEEYSIHDPLEPVNRFFFGFNDFIYEAFLRPVTHGYMWVVPREIRTCFGNFFFYLSSPVRLLNSLLQGDVQQAGVVLERFVIKFCVCAIACLMASRRTLPSVDSISSRSSGGSRSCQIA
jgi:hypothetical protein